MKIQISEVLANEMSVKRERDLGCQCSGYQMWVEELVWPWVVR